MKNNERIIISVCSKIILNGWVRSFFLLVNFFWVSMVIFFSCSGTFNYYVFDQSTYNGPTGRIFAMSPLHVKRIDGMSLRELKEKYNMAYTSGGHTDAFVLTTGEHIIHIVGGTSGGYSGSTTTIVVKITAAIRFVVEENHEYVVSYEVFSPSSGKAYMYDKTADKRVGTSVPWETGIVNDIE
jgi:hypothetical protein